MFDDYGSIGRNVNQLNVLEALTAQKPLVKVRIAMIQKRGLIAYAAAAWALIFGIFHLIWAMGWYVGLESNEAEKAFARPLSYAFDLLVAAMCAVAVLIALAFARRYEKRKFYRSISALAWSGTILLVLRSSASVVQMVYLLVTKAVFR